MRRPFLTNSSFNVLSSAKLPSMICNASGRHSSICFLAQTLTDRGRLAHSPWMISTGASLWLCFTLALDENLKHNNTYCKNEICRVSCLSQRGVNFVREKYVYHLFVTYTYIVGLVSVATEMSLMIGMMKIYLILLIDDNGNQFKI